MSIALYRKYRSATFADLIGQEHVATTLRNEVRTGALAHAYLFAGIRGTGKTSTARILARAVCCLDAQDGEPCNRCTACLEILGGGAVDVLEIDAASNRGIDEMRDLREKTRFMPASLRRKVYIVDEAHMLTTEAWNAFLKTLEEPPAHVLFVLATTEPHKVPETVRSRVQRFDFRRVASSEVARHLAAIAAAEGVEVEPAALDLLARAGQGSVRDALSLLDQSLAAGVRPLDVAAVHRALGLADPATVRLVLAGVAAADAAAALRAAATAFDAGADARQLLREMSRLARAAELSALGAADAADLSADDAAAAADLARVGRRGVWVDAVDLFAQAEINLRQPVDARLQVELALLRLTAAPAGSPAGDGDLAGRLGALERRLADAETALADQQRSRGGALQAAARPPRQDPPSPAGTAPSVPPAATADVTEPRPRAAAMPTLDPLAAAPEAPAPPGVAARPAGGVRGVGDGAGEEPADRAGTRSSAPSPVDAGASLPRELPEESGTGEVSAAPAAESASPAVVAPSATAVAAAAAGALGDGPRPATLEDWLTAWPLVVDAVKRRDPMLAGVLHSCRPIEGAPGRLVVGAPYGFHLERLQDAHKRRVLADAVGEVAGQATVEAVFSGEEGRPPVAAAATPAGGEDTVRAALAAFPGATVTGTRLKDARTDA